MKRKIFILIAVAAVICLALSVVACTDEKQQFEYELNYSERQGTVTFVGDAPSNSTVGKSTVMMVVPAEGYKVESVEINGEEKLPDATMANGVASISLEITLKLTIKVEFDRISAQEDDQKEEDDNIVYSVKAVRHSGHALSGYAVIIYDEEAPVSIVPANKNGAAVFRLPAKTYSFEFANLPEGFLAESRYTITAENPDIVVSLGTELIKSPAPNDQKYELGSVMHDFSFTDTEGKSHTLSQLLEKKKAVFINFWFINCVWCVAEFPDMQTAYNEYSDDIAIIGLNFTDNAKDSEDFRTNASGRYSWDELPFMMVGSGEPCSSALAVAFGVEGCPTSVMIDREGVVCFRTQGGADKSEFMEIFDCYTKEPYTQVIRFPGEAIKPDKPTMPNPESSAIEAVMNKPDSGYDFKYYFDKDEYNWPWVVSGDCVKAANSLHNYTYAIMYTDAELDEEHCLAFDFKVSSQYNADFFYVFVDDIPMHFYSGSVDWQTCYAYVPYLSGKHTVAFAYVKDGIGADGDDTAYIKNIRIVDKAEISQDTKILYACATGKDLDSFVTAVLGSDGYYHVGTEDGPLVLADLMNSTGWSETSFWGYVMKNGFNEDVTYRMTQFCGYANSSRQYGLIAVTTELKGYIDMVLAKYGSNVDSNTWLKLCSFYKIYGPNERNMEDPTFGLADYNSYTAELTTDLENPVLNHVKKEMLIMPRGLWYKFVPDETAVYRIASVGDELDTYFWIVDEEGRIFGENDDDPYYFGDEKNSGNFAKIITLEGGKIYYLLMDFNNPEGLGEFDFVVQKIAKNGLLWKDAAGGDYTAEFDESGNIRGGLQLRDAVDCVLGSDGYYHVRTADGEEGPVLYINLCGTTSMFQRLACKDMVDIPYYYCLKCGAKYGGTVNSFEMSSVHYCGVCGASEDSDFGKTFEYEDGTVAAPTWFVLPTARLDKTGNALLLVYDHGADNGKEYVPMYELNVEISDADLTVDEYMKHLPNGIKFVDYTETIEYYIALSNTDYPDEDEVWDTGSHKGFVAASEELVEILNKLILFGNYSYPNIKHPWLMWAAYYDSLGDFAE